MFSRVGILVNDNADTGNLLAYLYWSNWTWWVGSCGSLADSTYGSKALPKVSCRWWLCWRTAMHMCLHMLMYVLISSLATVLVTWWTVILFKGDPPCGTVTVTDGLSSSQTLDSAWECFFRALLRHTSTSLSDTRSIYGGQVVCIVPMVHTRWAGHSLRTPVQWWELVCYNLWATTGTARMRPAHLNENRYP